MPAAAPSARKAPDEFDLMANKLQKSLKQRQRHSVQARPHVTRLTPAEIRQLNHSASAAKPDNAFNESFVKPTASHANRRSINATPPASPDAPVAYQRQLSRASTVSLPTPPDTPSASQPRRASQSSTEPRHHSSHHGYHHPRPRSNSKQTEFLNANGIRSRPSNDSTSSSVHGMPMYRGHEVTRTGSFTAFQRPSKDIVNNPLSMFSRPRQATVNSAPDSRRESVDMPDLDPFEAQAMLAADEAEEQRIKTENEHQQIQRMDSPVSINDVRRTEPEEVPSVHLSQSTQRDGLNGFIPTPASVTEEPVARHNPDDKGQIPPTLASSAAPEKPAVTAVEDATRKVPKKRFTFHSGILDRKQKDKSQEVAVLTKKERRRTVSFTKATEDPAQDLSTAEVPKSNKISPDLSDEEIPAHPAVRPLKAGSVSSRSSSRTRQSSTPPSVTSSATSVDTIRTPHVNPLLPAQDKAKVPLSLVVPKGPVYGRCACCGRLKRPHAFNAELSPVLENEHIKTNFNIELDRCKTHSSDSSEATTKPKKYIPIIPMEIPDEGREGSIRTVQASIEPMHPPIEASGALAEDQIPEFAPRSSKRNSGMSDVVRFASLHKLKTDGTLDDGEDGTEEIVASTPVVDPMIKPKTSIALVPRSVFDSKDSLGSISTASVATARPISMMPAKASSEVDMGRRPISHHSATAASEHSGNPSSATSTTRNSKIDDWYEHAIKEGPKQDVITVVGWNKGKKMDEPDYHPPQASTGNVVSPPGASPVKETSPYEAQTAINNRNNAAPSPTKENKRLSFLSGGFFKKKSPKPEEAKLSTNSTPSTETANQSPPLKPDNVSTVTPTTHAANGFITAPTSQATTRPPSFYSSVTQSHADEPSSKFDPYSSDQNKSKRSFTHDKGYKLSLNNGSDMDLDLPSFGPRFSATNQSLHHLVTQPRPTPEGPPPRTPEMIMQMENAIHNGSYGGFSDQRIKVEG